MPDAFQHHQQGLESPAFKAAAVTPHDTNDLTDTPRGLYVGGTGDLVLICKNDSAAVPLKNVQAGTLLPIAAKRVLATGTTATFIVALW